MKLYGFANFVEQYLVSYEYASISSVIIEASMWLLQKGILLYDGDSQLMLYEALALAWCYSHDYSGYC